MSQDCCYCRRKRRAGRPGGYPRLFCWGPGRCRVCCSLRMRRCLWQYRSCRRGQFLLSCHYLKRRQYLAKHRRLQRNCCLLSRHCFRKNDCLSNCRCFRKNRWMHCWIGAVYNRICGICRRTYHGLMERFLPNSYPRRSRNRFSGPFPYRMPVL